MTYREAQNVVGKMQQFKGMEMKPLNKPVKDFLIVPAQQKDFDQMFKIISEERITLDEALVPYHSEVSVLVYFDIGAAVNMTNHCDHRLFLAHNNIEL